MTTAPRIEPQYLTIVRDILGRTLPDGYHCYVFGSRATGIGLKPWSDLDLAIKGPKALGPILESRLRDEFDEAVVPWKVDIIDLLTVSADFRRIVDASKVPLAT